MEQVLIEAESFDEVGGWVIDQQFMDIMGSPFLLAHGLGRPVEDATTSITLPTEGDYKVWVRTRDWVKPWNKEGSPGKFQVLVDGIPLKPVFGTEKADWHWQDGGIIKISTPNIKLSLHDLTGFEGRCDAILFSKDLTFIPPNEGKELEILRKKLSPYTSDPIDNGIYDVVVVGGGIAGICTAVSASRFGLTVALVHDRNIVGGNNSSEIRVWLGGDINLNPYPRIGDLVKELEQKKRHHYGSKNVGEIYEDQKKQDLLTTARVSLYTNHRMNEVICQNSHIQSVIAQNIINSQKIKISGEWFVDCTGDGCVGALAGADFEMTKEGHMGQCNLWNVKKTKHKIEFPRCPWAFDLSSKPFPGRQKDPRLYGKVSLRSLGGWYWESGFSRDPIKDDEFNRDTNFMAMYGAWDCLKNTEKVFEKYTLNWASYISGRRESRRLLGDVILNEEDLHNGVKYKDGCVPTGWDMDVHVPKANYQRGFEGTEFISQANFTKYPRPFWIPLRALYSRNIDNLLMAGRNISVTHQALGAVRVMRTGGMMGEIIGMALSLCKEFKCSPREIHKDHLPKFLELVKQGVPPTEAKKNQPRKGIFGFFRH